MDTGLQLTFDYAALDLETRIVVQQRTEEIRVLVRRSAQDIIDIGAKLIDVKSRLGHGNFGPWLNAEFGWTQQTATNFMHVADKFKNFLNLDSFAPSALYMLAAPSTPEPARLEAIERASNGETITYTTAKEIVTEYRTTTRYVNVEDEWGSVETLPTFAPLPPVRTLPLTAANHAPSADPNYDGDEWFTPPVYIEAAKMVMGGIDLDPASCADAQTVVMAEQYFTKENDGLLQSWHGRIWMNPPYSTPAIMRFVEKLIAEYSFGNVTQAIALTNNSSDTAWFHDLLTRYPACFVRGRVQFWRPNAENFGTRQGQTIFYLGENFSRFSEVFSKFGQIMVQV